MKGLERITQRIQTDAQGQIEALTAAGRRQAQEITEKYEDQARQLSPERRRPHPPGAAPRLQAAAH